MGIGVGYAVKLVEMGVAVGLKTGVITRALAVGSADAVGVAAGAVSVTVAAAGAIVGGGVTIEGSHPANSNTAQVLDHSIQRIVSNLLLFIVSSPH